MNSKQLIKLIDKIVKIRLEKLFSSNFFIKMVESAVQKYLNLNNNKILFNSNKIIDDAKKLPFLEEEISVKKEENNIFNNKSIISSILKNTNPNEIPETSFEESMINEEIIKLGIDSSKIEFNSTPRKFIDKYESEYINDND